MICIWRVNCVPDQVLRGQPCLSWIKNVCKFPSIYSRSAVVLRMISRVKSARYRDRECWPARNRKDHRNSSNEQCYPLSCCWLGSCIGNLQPGKPGFGHYNTADVNKQLVHAREKYLCGCITRFSTFLWRPLHDSDVKLPNHFTGDIKTECFFPF